MSVNIFDYLRGNSYPGRGIMIGKSPDGKKSIIAYFIMGRSENSRNRVFAAEGDGMRTKAFDAVKLTDPSLVIYWPVRKFNDTTIVTNGDQTDTIADSLAAGQTFEDALRTREFEPDAPNYTPRISGIVAPDGSYKLSILKCGDAESGACDRFFYEYAEPRNGVGHFISTYEKDGDPIPSYRGEPLEAELGGSVQELADGLWSSLNADNKVSLFVRYIDIESGAFESVIINKHGG